MQPIQLSLLITICLVIQYATCANILVMLPLPLFSHTNNYLPIFKELAKRGHNITMVSPFPQKSPIANFKDIVVPDLMHKLLGNTKDMNFVEMDGLIFDLIGLWWFSSFGLRTALECEQVKELIKDTDSKFDLVITETWFIQEPLVAFGHKFNAPVINVASTFIMSQTAHLTGNELPVSYVPNRKLPFTDHMSIMERFMNSFYHYWDVIVGDLYYIRKQDAVMREYFKYPGSENLPPLSDMLRNTALTLMDSNFATSYPAPLQKNIVEFGGINIKKNEKLPEDLQKFMDNAKEGVIYFSFGSHLNVSTLNPEIQQAIINTLGKLKQKVMMKLEASNKFHHLVKQNTLAKAWFPQAAVLAHPNCKLFVTHGGGHGLMEGVYNAVPMVTIPLIADQKFNSKFIESTGIGVTLKWSDVNEKTLTKAINTVLNDNSYRERINERSAIFKDQPISIMDNVIFWIEYVIRHKGAPHLRPAVLDLYWFQYLLLDVILLYALILILVLLIVKKIVMSTFNLLKWLVRGKKSTNKSKKKKE